MNNSTGSSNLCPEDWWASRQIISVVVDNESWILPFANTLVEALQRRGYASRLYRDYAQVPASDVLFMLGCTGIARPVTLARNRRNLVVHESDLPTGRGFAPLTYQVLEGKNVIPICLLEADEAPDAGPVYLRSEIRLDGTELNPELRQKQGIATVDICLRYIDSANEPGAIAQTGEPSWYRRRTPADSELDINQTIAEQFDLLRVVDNQRYPAFFRHKGKTYVLKIEEQAAHD